jgi:hypothetical protein
LTPILLLLAGVLLAAPSAADMNAEIDHLLHYIEAADCTFDRNGTMYDPHAAAAHIRKKYAYARRWIESAEDFIRYAATESSMSGRPYAVICDGVETPTADWLTDELNRFRQSTR